MRDLSQNIENGAQNSGRQNRYIVKIYCVLENLRGREFLWQTREFSYNQGARVSFRSGCTQRHHTRGRLC